MIRLFLLYAILIFAKKAPKLIADLLKIDSKDGVGLKGLNIKNKMGEAALVGGAVKKGMNKLEGRTKGAIGGGISGFMNTKGDLKTKLKAAAAGSVKGGRQGAKTAGEQGSSKGTFANNYRDVKDIKRGGRPTIWDNIKGQTVGKISSKADEIIGKGGMTTTAAANAKEFGKLQARLQAMYGASKADKIMELYGINNTNFSDEIQYGKNKKILKGLTETLHDPNADQRYIKQNVLSERDKLYNNIADYNQRIQEAMNSHDSDLAAAITTKRDECLEKAVKKGVLRANPDLGIDAVNLTGADVNLGIVTDSKAAVNSLLADISVVTKKNKKALDAVTTEIEESGKPAEKIKEE